MLPATVWM